LGADSVMADIVQEIVGDFLARRAIAGGTRTAGHPLVPAWQTPALPPGARRNPKRWSASAWPSVRAHRTPAARSAPCSRPSAVARLQAGHSRHSSLPSPRQRPPPGRALSMAALRLRLSRVRRWQGAQWWWQRVI